MPNCLLEETVLNGYSFFHGANNLQLHVTRRNIVNTNEVMVLLKVPLPADRKNSCSEGLEKYCQKLHTGKVRNRKRHRKFINMFCEPSCWAQGWMRTHHPLSYQYLCDDECEMRTFLMQPNSSRAEAAQCGLLNHNSNPYGAAGLPARFDQRNGRPKYVFV